MKKLRAKFKNKIKLKTTSTPETTTKKLGCWCSYYPGRLPYPIECSNNKAIPVSTIFKDGKPRVTRNYPACVYCDRNPSFASWKRGDWAKIIQAIADGEDLRDHPAPQ
jgi:hypothetical protein